MRGEFQEQAFKNEQEEAEWWDRHEDALAEEFERADSEGTLGHGTARAHMNSE